MALILMSFLIAGDSPAARPQKTRAQAYRRSMVGKGAFVRSGASATLGELRNSPHEWGRGGTGFAKRFGSHFAQSGVKNTIQHGVGALRHEQFGYVRSNRQGFGPRMKYAVANTFLARRDGGRKRSVATGRISGAFGSGLVSRLWMPARLHTVGSGLSTGGYSLAFDVAGNTFREFWPDIHQHMGGKRAR